MAEENRFAGNRFKKAVPSLPVDDCAKAIRYYCEVLGFKKDFDDSIPGVEKALFAGVSRGECEITLNQNDHQDYRATVGCEVDDVDLLHEEFRSRGATIIPRTAGRTLG